MTIKDMPTYDPDTEVFGLALTIPSWRSSIERIRKNAKMEQVSAAASGKLCFELRSLRDEIVKTLQKIEGGSA